MRFEFLSELVTKSMRPGWAQVKRAFEVHSERLGGKDVVWPGFEFDWDSVPRIPGLHASLKGRAEKAACYHDWLYRYQERMYARHVQPVTRRQADLAFLDAMVAEGVARRHRWPIYLGVRMGGWISWRKHRRALNKGTTHHHRARGAE
ncbi:DUF1353 domain-containing protein [Thioalkalivibrio sp. ALJ8]|uniref:DUF1353 domain-containing protein n=1 Tax=Thioalkalivibrio sp. ALJ8 TaxID=1158757 RepID=UPI000376CEA0|nr:DUF1353 domain-containing protein [Thioalkalivibrio sp. ALJ8]